MPPYISKQQRYGQLWLDEAERCAEGVMCDEIEEIAECADLAEEVEAVEELLFNYEGEVDYSTQYEDWLDYVYEHNLMLVIEQASYQGVMLEYDMRSLRLESCHPNLLSPFNMMVRHCPSLIMAELTASFSIAVRVERVQRTGNPDWSPLKAKPEPEPRAFFRPPLVKYRDYSR
jgi:hypothetical protein